MLPVEMASNLNRMMVVSVGPRVRELKEGDVVYIKGYANVFEASGETFYYTTQEAILMKEDDDGSK